MHRETGEVIIPAIYNDIEMVSPTIFYAELNGVDGGILFKLNGCRRVGKEKMGRANKLTDCRTMEYSQK